MLNQHQTNRDNIKRFNKPSPLVDYLLPFLSGKKEARILDIGSGPYSIIGDHLDIVKIELHLADNQDFTDFWMKYKATPFFDVKYQNMEQLTYVDEYFDLVHCANALDHTKDARKAVEEMIRVCKPGGWVYIDCHLDQAKTGHKHKWNATEEGYFISGDGKESFDLKSFGFNVEYIDRGGERRYNHIVATLQK